jgi:lipoate-protein ligase A
MDALENAIRPPVEKLERHGVPSVRQRVRNIRDIADDLELSHESLKSVEGMEAYLISYFTDDQILLDISDIDEIEKMSEDFIIKH